MLSTDASVASVQSQPSVVVGLMWGPPATDGYDRTDATTASVLSKILFALLQIGSWNDNERSA